MPREHAVAVAWTFGLVALTVFLYLAIRYSKDAWIRKAAAFLVATISALLGYLVTIGYAIPSLGDLHNPRVGFGAAIIGNLIIWTISVGAWVVAVRFVLSAFGKS